MNYTAIFVPGIADDIGYVQSTLVRLWRFRKLSGQTHVMPWAGSGNYDAAAERLDKHVGRLHNQGKSVVLVGASAGATAVLNAYCANRDKIVAVILICPKVNDSTNINDAILKKNPAFKTSIELAEKNQPTLTAEDRQRFSIFISPRDGLVSKVDSLIPQVPTSLLVPLRHNLAILYALLFGFGRLRAEVTRITAQQ